MTFKSRSIPVLAVAGLAVAAGAVCLGRGQDAAAQDETKPAVQESVSEKVERLLPDLMSESAPARERAERELIALGEPARAELDRLTRDPDPKKAVTAVKLLQSDRWERLREKAGDGAGEEERAARDSKGDRVQRLRGRARRELGDLGDEIDRRLDEMRRELEAWQRDFNPDEWLRDWAPEVGVESIGGARGASSGSVVENDRSLSWSIDAAGKVKVTVKDGADKAEATYEAPSLDELRREHPDVAKRLEGYLPQGGGRRFRFAWPPRHRSQRATRPQEERAQRDDTRGATETAPGLLDGERRLELSDETDAVPGPLLGIGCSSVPDVLREQLDLPAGGGIVIESVTPGSLAEKLGLRRNDVLVKLAGRAIASPPDVRRALEDAEGGGKVEAEIVRKGKAVTLSATR